MPAPLKNWFKARFLAGFFFTVPVFATAWILWVFWSWVDDIFGPIYRRLYPSVKMLIDSFSPERRSAFKAVVLVQHPRDGAYAFGFVTSEVWIDAPEGKQDMLTVFVPTNNLYLGDVTVVPRADVITTGMGVEEGIRIILSAGTATPPRLPRQ